MKIFRTFTLALCVAAAVSCAPQNNEKEDGMKKTNEVIETIMARRVLSTYDGDLRDRSAGLRKGQSPCEFFRGLSGFLSRRCRGLRPSVESGPEPEDSSPVLTWILGYFWSLPRGVSPRLECAHALALSSRAVAAVSRSPPRGSKHLWFSHEAFPRGFPTGLSHVHT